MKTKEIKKFLNTQEQVITFETAKLAKDKGFNEWTCENYPIEYYGELNSDRSYEQWNELVDYYSAPNQSILQKWLREEHNIIVLCHYIMGIKKYNWWIDDDNEIKSSYPHEEYDTYEEALERALQEGLNYIK